MLKNSAINDQPSWFSHFLTLLPSIFKKLTIYNFKVINMAYEVEYTDEFDNLKAEGVIEWASLLKIS